MSNLSRLMLVATLAMLAVVPAKADVFKFYSGGAGYAGPFNGAGTVYAATSGQPINCPGGGSACNGGADQISTPQNFTGGSANVTATANTAVWNDLSPNFAGLGVGLLSQGSDADQISGTDLLTLTFNVPVRLTGVGTLFDLGHTPFGDGFPDNTNITANNTFLLNGVPTKFGDANSMLLSLIGTIFTFQQQAGQPAFYVGGLTYSVNQVPLPGAVWLFASGIAGIGVLARRRRKNQSAIAA